MFFDNQKKYERVVFPEGFEIYKDHDIIPIDGVAEALGIDLKPNGRGGYRMKCPCPDHDDNNPSADITTSGRYANTFKCWSCNEGGGPLELVIAVQGGMSPSKYWDIIKSRGSGKYSRQDYTNALEIRNNAAKFIDEIYPGAIRIEKAGSSASKEELKRPELPQEIWDELKNWVNIDRNVGFQKMITIMYGDEDKEGGLKEKYNKLDDSAYANLLYDKLCEVQDILMAYKRQIFKDFPDLDGRAKMTIIETIEKRVEKIEIHIERIRDYMLKLDGKDVYEDMYDEKDLADVAEYVESLEKE